MAKKEETEERFQVLIDIKTTSISNIIWTVRQAKEAAKGLGGARVLR